MVDESHKKWKKVFVISPLKFEDLNLDSYQSLIFLSFVVLEVNICLALRISIKKECSKSKVARASAPALFSSGRQSASARGTVFVRGAPVHLGKGGVAILLSWKVGLSSIGWGKTVTVVGMGSSRKLKWVSWRRKTSGRRRHNSLSARPMKCWRLSEIESGTLHAAPVLLSWQASECARAHEKVAGVSVLDQWKKASLRQVEAKLLLKHWNLTD